MDSFHNVFSDRCGTIFKCKPQEKKHYETKQKQKKAPYTFLTENVLTFDTMRTIQSKLHNGETLYGVFSWKSSLCYMFPCCNMFNRTICTGIKRTWHRGSLWQLTWACRLLHFLRQYGLHILSNHWEAQVHLSLPQYQSQCCPESDPSAKNYGIVKEKADNFVLNLEWTINLIMRILWTTLHMYVFLLNC